MNEVKTRNHGRIPILAGFGLWLIAAVFYGLDYLQHTIPSVLIKPIAMSLGVHYTVIATIMSVYFPVYALTQIPAGYLIDRYGLRITMSSACFLLSLALLLLLIPNPVAILSGRIIIAIGSAFALIGTYKSISLYLPRSYFPYFIGFTQTIGTIGGLIGQVFINYLIGLHGWQQAIADIAIFGVIWSVVIALFLRDSSASKEAQDTLEPALTAKHQLIDIFKDKNIWLLAIYAAIMVAAVMNTFAELYDVIFLETSLHITSQQATYITMFIFIGVGIGAPIHGMIARQFSKQRYWLSLCAFMTFVIFVMISIASVWSLPRFMLIVMYFLLGFFVVSMMLSFSMARCCYPVRRHATIFALVNTIIGIAGFCFPVLFGWLIHAVDHYVHLKNELVVPLLILSLTVMISFAISFFIVEESPAS